MSKITLDARSLKAAITPLTEGYYAPPWPLTEENAERTAGWQAFQDCHANLIKKIHDKKDSTD